MVNPRFPNCIGWIYRELYDFESARKYNEEGIEVSRRHHVMEAEANSLINRGIDHTHDGEHEKTAVAFHEVRDIFERDAWFRWRYNIRLEAAMAEHWLRQGDLEKARGGGGNGACFGNHQLHRLERKRRKSSHDSLNGTRKQLL